MNKILMVGSSASMLKNFNMRNIKILLSLGCEVDVAANFENPGSITVDSADRFRKELEGIGVNVIDVPFERRMGTLKGNFEACIILMQLLRHKEYTFVHVHSALAGVLTRFVAAINHVPVIYTVHGFQFMKGGSLKRWLAFFPVEWVLSIFTKVIISINDEDNLLLKNFSRFL